ncbi:hypothetical protein HDG34_007237 [Paraburkholderia sp. HC6.4b]|uniref:hypothetical protein n=1 Tax=unclassified Paraburkholderia TaxID=2615204 RepID=UPI00160B6FA0|nr:MULTISPECIES: hypothetical protein [unclassified Paraburkholderia]MBB5413259.1 hypothetical protein [Paraburkholderia sp. HC6.4b]MBB5455540.1 hypothetical protein [Paraburkholderia sp. Kb1A]
MKRIVRLAYREKRIEFVGGDGDLNRHAGWTGMPITYSTDATIYATHQDSGTRASTSVTSPKSEMMAACELGARRNQCGSSAAST